MAVTFTSHINLIKKNTVRTKGIQITLRTDVLFLNCNVFAGEHMTEYELAEYLMTLLGFHAEGGSSELQDFDTNIAGDVISENLPHEITADMFANEVLGFAMFQDNEQTA